VDPLDAIAGSVPAAAKLLVAMAALAALETIVPLRRRATRSRGHAATNLRLTLVTFALNAAVTAAIALALAHLDERGLGLLNAVDLPPVAAGALALVVLDLAFYVSHVAMHRIPGWWRFHRVHHADPSVDVTTSFRQHPVEGLIRYAFVGAFALVLAPSVAAFGVYRAASALNALLEHANLRMPPRLDRALSLVTTWPYAHKVHHSRDPSLTDTNYGNLLSLWDRIFGTFTPSAEGTRVVYGLDGFEGTPSALELLASPWTPLPRVRDAGTECVQ